MMWEQAGVCDLDFTLFLFLKLEVGPGFTPGRGQINSISSQNTPVLSCSGKEVIDFSSARKGFKEIIKNPGEINKVPLSPPSRLTQ